MKTFDSDSLDWQKGDDLLPAIIQDAETAAVLMLGYMNKAALEQTLVTQKVTFYSRSKQRLWVKGESSGHYLNLVSIQQDCDNDTLLIQAQPQGPTCHLGTPTCFAEAVTPIWQILQQLETVIKQRARDQDQASYSVTLLQTGINRVAQKVGEEAVETVIASLAENDDKLCSELADLFYHILVLLQLRELSLSQVLAVLQSRFKG